MNVNSVNSTNLHPGAAGIGGGQMDTESKNLQQQIERLQQELKEVSTNQDIPADTKMKKRQDIQKQISELQIQLRQHQIEARKEERQSKKEQSSFDDLMGTKSQAKQSGTQNVGMSAGSMEAMISADVSVKQANANGSTAKKMEGKANVLEAEIKLDSSRGGNVESKEAQLAEAKEAAGKAAAAQMDSLAQASETLQSASKEERTGEQKADGKKDSEKTTGSDENKEQKDTARTAPAGEVTAEETDAAYHPVDVRL